jgi:DNA-binding NarL/FixJ family response regulator
MLAGAHNLAVVGEASNGREALEVCGRLHPDLVLMDLQLGDMDGLAVTRAIRQAWPTTSVLLFTMHETPHYAVEAHRAGANGYVLKGATRRELLDAVYSALATPGKTDRGQRAPPTGTQNAKRGSGLQSGDCPVM